MRAAQSHRRRGLSLLLLAILLGWAAPCFALTELSGSPPWQLNIAGETYQFAASLGDSIQYDGTSAVLQFQAANITLNGRGFTITHYSGVANELIQLSSTGARINQLRSVNLELEFPSGADAIFDGCDFEIRHLNFGATPFASKLVSLTSSSSDVRFWNCRLASVSTRDMIDVAGTDHAFENCLAISTNQEAFLLGGAGPCSIIGCTIGGFGQGAVVSNMANPATLAMYNNIILSTDEICFEATDPTWTGLSDSDNWYNSGFATLITYGGVNYTDATTFEANSLDGSPGLVDADETINGDYRVINGSGPVDVGDSARNTLILDLLGNPRERGTIDMGCYEYQPSDQGSCCFSDGSCVVTTQSLCVGDSGTWAEGGNCAPVLCAQPGACCVGGLDDCEITLDSLCDGTFLGEGTVCDPGVCVFGCPPPGYAEIETLPVTIGANNSKWAICGDIVSTSATPFGTNDFAGLIRIAANNVSITGMGNTISWGGTADPGARNFWGIYMGTPMDGLTIRDLNIEWNGDDIGEIIVVQGSTNLRNVDYETDAAGMFWENKSLNEFTGCEVDSCTFTQTRGVGFVVGASAPVLPSSDMRFANTSWYFLDPNYYSCDVKPMRFWWIDDSIMENCNVVMLKGGSYPSSHYAQFGGTGCTQDAEPIGWFGCHRWEIDTCRMLGFRNPDPAAMGNVGFIDWRKPSDSNPDGSEHFYMHDSFIWSDYLGLNASGIGRHRTERCRIFSSMSPERGTTQGEGYGYLISSASRPCCSIIEDCLIVNGESETVMINYGGGADSIISSTIVSLDEVYNDGHALRQSGNTEGTAGPLVLRNNIFVNSKSNVATITKDSASDVEIDADYNLYWNRSGGPIIEWEGTEYTSIAAFRAAEGQETNGLQGNPGFISNINALSDTLTNFALRASSIGIDEGDNAWLQSLTDLAGNDRTVGVATDLGAYEYTDVVPTLQGACCQVDGTCSVSTESDCEGLLGGTYQGDNTDCDPNPCPILTQACCYPDGTCDDLTPAACTSAGGAPRGSGTTCATTACASSGACCFASGSCAVLSNTLCAFVLGQFQGPGTDCDPNPCAQPTGACCIAEVCSITTGAGCAGDYQGNGTLCTPDPCDLPAATGACCFAFSFCQVLTEAECGGQGGTYEGDATDCDPNPCPETLGACCASDGSCTLDDVTDCTTGGGSWYGAGSICTDTDCPQPTGACCLAELVGGSCIVSTEDACLTANGEWHQGEHCDDVDCTRSITGGTRVIYGEATYISSFGSTTNHCDGTTLRLGAVASPFADGNLVIRFTTPALPSGARVIAAEIVGTVVTTTAGAEPADVEVYQLARDPVICEATWEVYATGADWGQDGGTAVPADIILPALTDQLGTGATLVAGTEFDLVTGPAALRFADELLRTGHAAILVTCELDHVWLSGDLGAAPVRMTLTYAVGSSRRRAIIRE